MARKLVTLRRISEIRPIPDADAIELVIVDGWQCVAQKAMNYKVGDYVFYFEIDSFLPTDRPEFSFLKAKEGRKTVFNGVEGHRLRTIRLRKQLSQGLLVPPDMDYWLTQPDFNEDDRERDFSDHFGVQLYEKPLPAQLAGTVRSTFPSFIPKTDQERVQNLTQTLMRRVADKPDEMFEVTIKLDGSSMTVYRRDDDIGVCSRNLSLKENDDNTFWKVAKQEGLIDVLNKAGRNIALQGELVGEGIQHNAEKINGQKFYLFDIYDIDAGRYFTPSERMEFVTNHPVNHVPVLGHTNLLAYDSLRIGVVSEILDAAEGPSVNMDNREGIVFKSATDTEFSFKAISNKYLLSEKD